MTSGEPSSHSPRLKSAMVDGALWKTASRAASTAVGAVGQLLLGWLLAEDDFGVYAIAISAAMVVRAAQDGGISLVLMRLTPEEFRRHANSGLVISGVSSLVIAAFLVGVSGPIAAFYGEPQVRQLLWVLAAATPLAFVWPVASAGLHGSMLFREVAAIEFLAAIIQPASTVVLAILGFGPFSFVIPIAFLSAFKSVAGWISLYRSSLTPRPGLVAGRDLLRLSPWAVAGTFGTFLYLNVDNLILGRIGSTAALGFYYFAYQIVQKALNPVDGLWAVAVPGFASLANDSERTQRATIVAGYVAGGLAAPIFMVLAAVADPLIHLMWSGKWDLASGSVAALSLATSSVLFVKLAETLVQAHAKFATWTAIVAIRVAAVGLAAGIGALLIERDNPTPASAVIGVAIVASSLAMVVFGCRSVGVASAPALRAFGAPFTFTVVGGLLLLGLGRLLSPDPLARLLVLSVCAVAWLQLGHLLLLRGTSENLRMLFRDRPSFRWLGHVYGFGWRTSNAGETPRRSSGHS